MVFGDGRPLDMAIEQNKVLLNENDVLRFLQGPFRHWEEDLNSREFFLPQGFMAYVSPFGLSIWQQRQFDSWIALQNVIDWNSAGQVQELLFHLMADEPLFGVSEQMQARLKNSALAHLEAADQRKVVAEFDKGRVYSEVAEKFRDQMPSLNIEFADDGNIETYLDALWIGRMVLREPLLRHLWISATREPMQEETAFLLAAFPELVPYWPLVQKWGISFRHYRLNLRNGFYHFPIGPLNQQGDMLFLDLRHAINLVQGRRTEGSYIRLIFKGDKERINALLEREWTGFLKVTGLKAPTPALQDDSSALILMPKRGFPRSRLLAFYFYLSYKYPSGGGTRSGATR